MYSEILWLHSVLMSRDATEGSKVIVRDGGIVKGLYEKAT